MKKYLYRLIKPSVFMLLLALFLQAGPSGAEEQKDAKKQEKKSKAVSMLFYRTGLVLMPSAITIKAKEYGLGFDALFDYFIGDLYSYRTDTKEKDWLAPLKYMTIGGDLKYTLWGTSGFLPAVAFGLSGQLPIKSSDSSGGKIDVTKDAGFLYGIYAVGTKRLSESYFTFGYMNGSMGVLMSNLAKEIYLENGRNYLFGGFHTKITSRSQIKVELIYSIERNYYGYSTYDTSKHRHPFMINTYITSFLGFEMGYLQYEKGFKLIGYVHARLPLYPERKEAEEEDKQQQEQKQKNTPPQLKQPQQKKPVEIQPPRT